MMHADLKEFNDIFKFWAVLAAKGPVKKIHKSLVCFNDF